MPYSDSISWTVARVASLLLVASTNLGAQGNTKESADLLPIPEVPVNHRFPSIQAPVN